TGRRRLARLVDLVDELGVAWDARPGPLVPAPEPGGGWERRLAEGTPPARARSRVTAGTAATPSDRPGTGRMTAERRFDLLVAGELNPDILIVDPTSGPA